MKDKFNNIARKINPFSLLMASITATAILIAVIHLSYPTKNFKNSTFDKIATINQSELVELETKFYIERIKKCKVLKDCEKIELKETTKQLIREIDRLISLAGTKDDLLRLVGNNSYVLLRINLKKNIDTDNFIVSLERISEDLDSIKNTHEKLIINTERELTRERQVRMISTYITLLITISLYLLTLYSKHLRSNTIKHNSQEVNEVLEKTAQMISSWDIKEFRKQLSEKNLNALERKAYSKILSMQKDLIRHENQMDLYRSLYGMIGFEIRGIAHSIKGGLKVLIKNTDEQGIFLAREITTATENLEDLAENFNRLLSLGEDSGSPTIEINNLIGNIATVLSAKLRNQGYSLECYTNPTIPPVVFGNQIGLFWILLLNFSNAIQRGKNSNVLLTVNSTSSKDIDSISIFFDFIITGSEKSNLKEITDKSWVNINDSGTAGNASLNLLSGISNYSVQWSTKDDMKRLRISIDVTPKEYANNDTPLEDKKILVCGDSTLQVDIINETISYYGAQSEHVKSPNDIFKSISRAKEFDAFLITDTIPGIDIPSFCKTLKSRLKKVSEGTKLLVSVGDPTMTENTLEYVDHIFYRPIDNQTLINKLKHTLEEVGDKSKVIENNILIVEDDAIQQILLAQLLNEFGISTNTADTGEEAIEHLEQNQPDMVFMDCIMPGMGGIEATRVIRANELRQNKSPITIIGATALSGNKDKKDCIDAGMDYIISKPYNDEEILKVIKNYLAAQKIN